MSAQLFGETIGVIIPIAIAVWILTRYVHRNTRRKEEDLAMLYEGERSRLDQQEKMAVGQQNRLTRIDEAYGFRTNPDGSRTDLLEEKWQVQRINPYLTEEERKLQSKTSDHNDNHSTKAPAKDEQADGPRWGAALIFGHKCQAEVRKLLEDNPDHYVQIDYYGPGYRCRLVPRSQEVELPRSSQPGVDKSPITHHI